MKVNPQYIPFYRALCQEVRFVLFTKHNIEKYVDHGPIYVNWKAEILAEELFSQLSLLPEYNAKEIMNGFLMSEWDWTQVSQKSHQNDEKIASDLLHHFLKRVIKNQINQAARNMVSLSA